MLPIAEYDYNLPPDLIAQTPTEPRDHSRLLVLDRDSDTLEHHHFYDVLRFLRPNDLLVVNDSRVLPARLHGHKPSGGRIEILLLRQVDAVRWEALVKGKVAVGTQIVFEGRGSGVGGRELGIGNQHSGSGKWEVGSESQLQSLTTNHQPPTTDLFLVPSPEPLAPLLATVEQILDNGSRVLRFAQPINDVLSNYGVMPTPPYITAPLADPERYQTVYSANLGSAAAPTAGLHWTPTLIERAKTLGVRWASVTLHVGLDTFRPVQTENALDHPMHSEWYELPAATATAINETCAAGGRVLAVGTTSVRVLETVASQQNAQTIAASSGWTNIFIYPPYQFRLVDGLITNFHLPRSTLLLLVSALAERAQILRAYQAAIAQHYRFFSFGDAMLIV